MYLYERFKFLILYLETYANRCSVKKRSIIFIILVLNMLLNCDITKAFDTCPCLRLKGKMLKPRVKSIKTN